jgi:hypothetical protein
MRPCFCKDDGISAAAGATNYHRVRKRRSACGRISDRVGPPWREPGERYAFAYASLRAGFGLTGAAAGATVCGKDGVVGADGIETR